MKKGQRHKSAGFGNMVREIYKWLKSKPKPKEARSGHLFAQKQMKYTENEAGVKRPGK